MARMAFGDRFDIHTASADLIFPHNENELAQSRALTGESQANFWLHSELVLSQGKKMTYGEDTCVTLPDLLERGYTAREIRFFLLQSHYRQPVHLTDERLEGARSSLRRLDGFLANLSAVTSTGPRVPEVESWIVAMKEGFREALFNDMAISVVLAAVFRLVRQVNYLMAHGDLHVDDAADVRAALRSVDEVLGVLSREEKPEELSDEVRDLLSQRDEARSQRDFGRADDIRSELTSRGYTVEDFPAGTRVRRRG
jgi:cysteinyl-tRNA synthetase